MPGLHKHAHMKPVPMVQVLVNTKHVTAHWPTRIGLLLKHHPYCRPMVSLRHVLTAFYMLWDCGHLAPATGPFCPDPWVKWPTWQIFKCVIFSISVIVIEMFSSHVDSLSVADACMLTLTPYEHLQRLIQRFMLRGAIQPRSPLQNNKITK